jgi:phospholipid transport system substrate-binding protein
MRRRIAPVATLAAVLLLGASAWAGSPTAELRGLFTAAARILEDPDTEGKHEERLSAIRAIVRETFDFREAAQLALGPDWSERTPAEQDEFVRLFGDLLERSVITGIMARIRLADGVKVRFVGESVDGDTATVRTTLMTRSGLDLPFDYRMIERGDRWAVRDVVIDGVSLAANYRAQFTRVIQASSYPELLRQMQERVPAPPVVATAVVNGRGTAPVTPATAPAPAAVQESTDPLPRPTVPVTTADVKGPDPLVGIRPVQRAQPEGIPVARAKLEPGPSAPPGEPREQPFQLPGLAPARPVAAAPPGARSYWVQVAAFKSLEAAMRLASLLRVEKSAMSDRWAVVMEPGSAGATLARVRVGPFSERAEAASNLRDLQALGYKPFIAEERD